MKKWIAFTALAICVAITSGAQFTTVNMLSKPIVEKKVSSQSVTYEELRMIYLLSITRWDDGQKIVVVTLPNNHPVQRRFLWEHLGVTPHRYKEIVDAKVAAGKKRPKQVKTESEMINYVGRTPGAIGYVGHRVYVNLARNVRTLSIRAA